MFLTYSIKYLLGPPYSKFLVPPLGLTQGPSRSGFRRAFRWLPYRNSSWVASPPRPPALAWPRKASRHHATMSGPVIVSESFSSSPLCSHINRWGVNQLREVLFNIEDSWCRCQRGCGAVVECSGGQRERGRREGLSAWNTSPRVGFIGRRPSAVRRVHRKGNVNNLNSSFFSNKKKTKQLADRYGSRELNTISTVSQIVVWRPVQTSPRTRSSSRNPGTSLSPSPKNGFEIGQAGMNVKQTGR